MYLQHVLILCPITLYIFTWSDIRGSGKVKGHRKWKTGKLEKWKICNLHLESIDSRCRLQIFHFSSFPVFHFRWPLTFPLPRMSLQVNIYRVIGHSIKTCCRYTEFLWGNYTHSNIHFNCDNSRIFEDKMLSAEIILESAYIQILWIPMSTDPIWICNLYWRRFPRFPTKWTLRDRPSNRRPQIIPRDTDIGGTYRLEWSCRRGL